MTNLNNDSYKFVNNLYNFCTIILYVLSLYTSDQHVNSMHLNSGWRLIIPVDDFKALAGIIEKGKTYTVIKILSKI